MIQIKLFQGWDIESVEEAINNWLSSKGSELQIKDITIQMDSRLTYPEALSNYYYIVQIVYNSVQQYRIVNKQYDLKV